MLRISSLAEVQEKDREHGKGRKDLNVETRDREKEVRIAMAPWSGYR